MYTKIDTFFNKLKFYEEIGFTHPKKALNLKNAIEKMTTYKVLQLVRDDIRFSYEIRDILKKDWSTIIDHLNKLNLSISKNEEKHII